MQNKSFLLFIAVSLLVFAGWMELRMRLWPPKHAVKQNLEAELKNVSPSVPSGAGDAVKAIAGSWAELKKTAPAPPKPAIVRAPAPAPPTPADKLLTMGDVDPKSRFHLQVVLDPRGAGVRSVTPNKFQEASVMGRPVWLNPATKTPTPLQLVPAEANRDAASNILYHYSSPDEPRPRETLGKIAWKVGPVEQDMTDDGQQRQRIVFETDVPNQGIHLTKTFTLAEGDYHIGLEVKLERAATEETPRKFRYQLTGGHGLPIEGRWYTSIFRNALIARVEGKDNVWRDMQDLREISRWEGGKKIFKEPGRPIRYAAVAVQYFASAIVVDNQQRNQDFLKEARPTLETAVARGVVRKIDRERGTFVLNIGENDDRTFHVTDDPILRDDFGLLKEGMPRAVIYQTNGLPETNSPYDQAIATAIAPQMNIQPLWEEDITVRVASEPIELKPGEPVTHKYLLYNGPVKPSLLAGMKGAAAVAPELVNRYAYDLSLNTMTDYHSPGPFGSFANAIYWSQLIIKVTNLMHAVLGFLYLIIPSYGICIFLLTVMVRGIMFPLSRKQALMSLRMQELAPEMKKIQEKYKDDQQGRGLAQMELYRKHKINPFGSCWMLVVQMPIFMGLYFALQESIHFRLAPFWPTWIINLAAPDMMIEWGQNIPYISRPEDYNTFLYLGPYFNLLPVIAAALMIVQQKMMTPPATNDEEAMRNAMMKYMMIFFGFMFYKVASGLCLYFVTSSLWGFAERKLLPKKKLASGTGVELAVPRVSTGSIADAARSKRKPERARKDDDNSTLGRLRAWWTEVLKQAEKK